MPVADVIAGGINRGQDLERRLAGEPSGTLVRFDFFRDRFYLQDSGLRLYEQGLGSSFILGHSTLGKIGTSLTPQPYLGDSLGALQTVTISGLSI